MKKSEEILRKLHREGESLEIPEGLEPEKIRDRLSGSKHRKKFLGKYRIPAAAMAACLCLSVGAWTLVQNGKLSESPEAIPQEIAESGTAVREIPEKMPKEEIERSEMTYEEIYARLSLVWDEQSMRKQELQTNRVEDLTDDVPGASLSAAKEELSEDVYGKTNVQEESVDEADQVKNDGRYLYQTAYSQPETEGLERKRGIQILDTRDGLKEVAFLDDFDRVEEFYVWEDLLIAVENKYSEYVSGIARVEADMAMCGKAAETQYHEISIYNIKDRTRPWKLKTFTFRGSYETSRITDGYFYGISRFFADPGEGKEDYGAYIPTLDGKQLSAEQIYCPEKVSGTGYLVLVSIDLRSPSVLLDSRAVLAGTGTYYVSPENIYVAQYRSAYEEKISSSGIVTDKTEMLRFSYRNGKFHAQSRGEVPGRVNDSFSMDEYDGYLRVVTTVQKYQVSPVTDERTGENICLEYTELSRSNGLYILARDLTVKGKIDGLAKDELVYSARFLGDWGYFVTFRQTDPLFAVDLSDPEKPVVKGELKVSGFSEYLHFYDDHLLLGIGMEADEETGRQEGMKLSMFDLSEPTELTEASRYPLTDYNFSEALYDHRAVLIDPEENLIGFSAEGSSRGKYWKKYLVFSYEDGVFVKKLEADMGSEDQGSYRLRGTFIGDRFYLLSENGSARAYDRESWEPLQQ